LNVFSNYYKFEIKFVNGVEAKWASLPRFFFVVVQVLKYARPAVNMPTFGDSGANHSGKLIHANWASNIS
jgi:hypothetical protein